MKILFRKHGSSFFYIILPVFFLLLTLAFIQLTPQTSMTSPGDTCNNSNECCTTSGCGADTSEGCTDGTCIAINLGCEVGTVNGTTAEDCSCVSDGVVVGQCVVCEAGEAFDNGSCKAICGPNDNPNTANCYLLDGGLEGSGFGQGGCSLNKTDSIPPSYPFYFLILFIVSLGFGYRIKIKTH